MATGKVESFNYVHSITPSEKVTINSGGYIQIGKVVILSVKMTSKAAISQNDILASGIPASIQNVAINIGVGYNANAYSCRTGGSNIYANGAIPNGTEMNLNIAYIT